jgi:3-oxoacyl-ACP reductase-like protein
MSIFSKILNKLGIGKKEETTSQAASAQLNASPTAAPAPAKPAAAPSQPAAKPPTPPPATAQPRPVMMEEELKERETAARKPAPISEVDVVKKLEEMSKGKNLNWKTSIVDLLTLLELDASKDARIELAKELGCPQEYIGGDYSKMNAWLHKEVLRQIAANGGNIPKELLD